MMRYEGRSVWLLCHVWERGPRVETIVLFVLSWLVDAGPAGGIEPGGEYANRPFGPDAVLCALDRDNPSGTVGSMG